MYFRPKQPQHLKRPLQHLIVGLAASALTIVASFVAAERMLPAGGELRSIVAALPGLAMSTVLLVIFLYLRHYDDMQKQLGIKALAASAVGGVVTLIVSTSRAAIGGYPELSAGTVIVSMAITFVLSSIYLSWRRR